MQFTKRLIGYAGLLLLSSSPSHAVELRYGSGEFQMQTAAKPFVQMDTTLDVDTWTLAETHKNFGNSRLYYQLRADYFDSDTVNKLTDLASTPLTTNIPIIGNSLSGLLATNTTLPVPADYRIHGVNLDVGVGYDVLRNERGHLGVGVNTGVSTPFMKVRNALPVANLAIKALDTFDTEIKTYKAGIGVQGSYQVAPWLAVSANAAVNKQTAELENAWVNSGFDMDGTYQTLEIAAKLKPAVLLQQPRLKNAFVSIGHTRSEWEYDNAAVSTPVATFNAPSFFDANASHENTWLGIGYDF